MELFTPDFGLIFWMFIAFGILFLILWKCAWPVILKSVDSRADLIDKGVEYAQEAKERLDGAQREADDMLREARRRQADELREADRMKAQIIEEARSAAQAEAQKVMDAAKVSIEQSRREAEKNIRDQVSQVALDIANRITRDQMKDTQAQKRLVNSILDEIETTN